MQILKDKRSRNGIILAAFCVLLCWGATTEPPDRYSLIGSTISPDVSAIEVVVEDAESIFTEKMQVVDTLANNEIMVAPELEAQLRIIAQSVKQWEYMAQDEFGFESDHERYTITDLDKNGRVELIVAQCLGSGVYTDACFYEVNASYDGLVDCVDVHRYENVSEADSAWADIIRSETDVYYDDIEDTYYYIFYDYVRYGGSGYYLDMQTISLKDGQIREDLIAAYEVLANRDGDVTTTFWNSAKEKISEDEYEKLTENPFTGLEKKTATFDWENDIDTSSEETIITDLKKAISVPMEYDYPMVITPIRTADIDLAYYSEGIFCVYNGEKYGYIKNNGVEITDYIFDYAYPFSEGYACVMIEGKYGFIDENGEVIIPFIYDDAAPFQERRAYFATEENYGFLYSWGEVAFYLDCDSVSSFQEGLAYFSINGKYGYIDISGNTVIEPTYSDADYFKDGIAFVDVNGYKGAINTEGEVVIPFEYDALKRKNDVILAATRELTGEVSEYYDLNGTKITKEEYEARTADESATTTGLSGKYDFETDTFRVLNETGEEVWSMECNYASLEIYNDYANYVLDECVDDKDRILLLEENKNIDLAEIVLKNSITPRLKDYWKLATGQPAEVYNEAGESYTEGWFVVDKWWYRPYIRKARLYDIDNSGNPILYCYLGDSSWRLGFPLSYSGFYAMQDGKVYRLLTGEECGGSALGDRVCLWKDIESGELYIGRDGAAGGFGDADYSSIYTCEIGQVEEISSVDWVSQTSSNYDDEELLEDAHLFYNDDYVPYTRETMQEVIKERQWIIECQVNDERVTLEEYKEECSKYVGVYFFD